MISSVYNDEHVRAVKVICDHLTTSQSIIGLALDSDGRLCKRQYAAHVSWLEKKVERVFSIVIAFILNVASKFIPSCGFLKLSLRSNILFARRGAETCLVKRIDQLKKQAIENQVWNEPAYEELCAAVERMKGLPDKLHNFSLWDKLAGVELSLEEYTSCKTDTISLAKRFEELSTQRAQFTKVSCEDGSEVFFPKELLAYIDLAALKKAFDAFPSLRKEQKNLIRLFAQFLKDKTIPAGIIECYLTNLQQLKLLHDFFQICYPDIALAFLSKISQTCAHFTWTEPQSARGVRAQTYDFFVPFERIERLSVVHHTGLTSSMKEASTKTIVLDPSYSLEMVQAIEQLWNTQRIDLKFQVFSSENWDFVCSLLHYAQGYCPSMLTILGEVLTTQSLSPDFTVAHIAKVQERFVELRDISDAAIYSLIEEVDKKVFEHLVQNFADVTFEFASSPFKDYLFTILNLRLSDRTWDILANKIAFERFWPQLSSKFIQLRAVKLEVTERTNFLFLSHLAKACNGFLSSVEVTYPFNQMGEDVASKDEKMNAHFFSHLDLLEKITFKNRMPNDVAKLPLAGNVKKMVIKEQPFVVLKGSSFAGCQAKEVQMNKSRINFSESRIQPLEIETLEIIDCTLQYDTSSSGLKNFINSCPKLRKIMLSYWESAVGFPFTSAQVVDALQNCKQLMHLDLSARGAKLPYAQLTDAECERIAKYCPKLQTLVLKNHTALTDEGLYTLASRLVELRLLNLQGSGNITSKTIAFIRKKFPKLSLVI